jgi:predicted dehydrogenase
MTTKNGANEMSAEIGVAVIGFGLAGRVFHAPFVSVVPGLRLEAIVQRKGDEAAKTYPSARILRSVEEALSDAADRSGDAE